MKAEMVLTLAGPPRNTADPVREPWVTPMTFRGKRVFLERDADPRRAERDIQRFEEWVVSYMKGNQ